MTYLHLRLMLTDFDAWVIEGFSRDTLIVLKSWTTCAGMFLTALWMLGVFK